MFASFDVLVPIVAGRKRTRNDTDDQAGETSNRFYFLYVYTRIVSYVTLWVPLVSISLRNVRWRQLTATSTTTTTCAAALPPRTSTRSATDAATGYSTS